MNIPPAWQGADFPSLGAPMFLIKVLGVSYCGNSGRTKPGAVYSAAIKGTGCRDRNHDLKRGAQLAEGETGTETQENLQVILK